MSTIPTDASDRARESPVTTPASTGGFKGLTPKEIAALAAAGAPTSGPPSSGKAIDALLKKAPGWRNYVGAVKAAAAARGNLVDPVQLLASLIFNTAGKPPADPRGMIANFASAMGVHSRTGIRAYAGSLDDWYGATFGLRADNTGPLTLFQQAGIDRYQPRLPEPPKPAKTPTQKAAAKAAQAKADLANQTLISTRAAAAAATAQAVATEHFGSNAWVTVQKGPGGTVTFGTATGPNAPRNALMQGGVPMTQADLSQRWSFGSPSYDQVFQEYTGRLPTENDIYGVINKGLTPYALQQQLAGFDPKTGAYTQNADFVNSPAYKRNAATVTEQATTALGKKPPPGFVAKAIVYNWSEADIQANARLLPGFTETPVGLQTAAQMKAAYQQIYGLPDAEENHAITQHVQEGWTPDQFAARLRSLPEYKDSAEVQGAAMTLLDTLGLSRQGKVGAPAPLLAPKKRAPGMPPPAPPAPPPPKAPYAGKPLQ